MDLYRCQSCKDVLRFVETHKYANFTGDQCYNRLAVCDLHFTNHDFLERPGLKYNAIPSLNLGYQTNMDASIQTDCVSLEEACLQADFNFDDKKCSDASSQTGTSRINSRSTQTTALLSANTPRKTILKEKIRSLKRASSSASGSKAPKCQRQLETNITIEDVHRFLEDKYPKKSCQLIKSQLDLLNKSPKGSRYSDEFKQFAVSVNFLGPKAYKQFSSLYRLPAKSTLNRFTRKWIVTPGFNDFIFGLLNFENQISYRNGEGLYYMP